MRKGLGKRGAGGGAAHPSGTAAGAHSGAARVALARVQWAAGKSRVFSEADSVSHTLIVLCTQFKLSLSVVADECYLPSF
jgi:hypothetical protein